VRALRAQGVSLALVLVLVVVEDCDALVGAAAALIPYSETAWSHQNC